MKLHHYETGAYALAGTKEELRAISDRLVKLLADMDKHDADAAAQPGARVDPTHTVTVGLTEVDGIEEVS